MTRTAAPDPRPTTDLRVDPARWPDVASVPDRGRLRPTVAQALVRRSVRGLHLRVLLPDGRQVGGGGPDAPALVLHRPDDFYARLGATGLIGFGESYMAGDWDADDLAGVLTVFAEHLSRLVPGWLQRLRAVALERRPHGEDGAPEQARTNIARHYDLSNDLFALFLDETMTYSSGLFARTAAETRDPGLADAQRRKIDRLLDLTAVRQGSRVLEIGTGWGELAIRAAERGATVTSITLSEEQRVLALRRAAERGVADRIDIELCDYRSATGRYDAVLSVEMIEAVGLEYLPAYFAAVGRLVTPGGLVGLQAITMPHDRMIATADTHTWVSKYIFPGGLIPSVRIIEQLVGKQARLRVRSRLSFGRDYAQTLRLWRERFSEQGDAVAELGFDLTFRRMWRLYLAYSEAGFRSGYLDVNQFVLGGQT